MKKFLTRELIMPKHLNAANTLFGGQALAWIDKEAAIYAICKLGTSRIVTKLMGEMNFMAPARLGDIIEIGCEVIKIGTTSIVLTAEIRNKTTQETIVTVGNIVFVSVDADGRPTPHGAENTVKPNS